MSSAALQSPPPKRTQVQSWNPEITSTQEYHTPFSNFSSLPSFCAAETETGPTLVTVTSQTLTQAESGSGGGGGGQEHLQVCACVLESAICEESQSSGACEAQRSSTWQVPFWAVVIGGLCGAGLFYRQFCQCRQYSRGGAMSVRGSHSALVELDSNMQPEDPRCFSSCQL